MARLPCRWQSQHLCQSIVFKSSMGIISPSLCVLFLWLERCKRSGQDALRHCSCSLMGRQCCSLGGGGGGGIRVRKGQAGDRGGGLGGWQHIDCKRIMAYMEVCKLASHMALIALMICRLKSNTRARRYHHLQVAYKTMLCLHVDPLTAYCIPVQGMLQAALLVEGHRQPASAVDSGLQLHGWRPSSSAVP